MRGALRAERRKLAAQLGPRLAVLVCLLGPFAFAAVLRLQNGTPTDTLLGAGVHASGFNVAWVVLGFAGTWGLPLLAGALAGDAFAAEDRLGTWRTLLTRSASREDIVAAKILAAFAVTLGLVLLLATASALAGWALVGAHPFVGLGGQLVPAGRGILLLAASWLLAAVPALAYTSLALLCSAATRSGIAGMLGPLLVALATELLALVGRGAWVHVLLPGAGFDAWHGLLARDAYLGPAAVATAAGLAWTAGCLLATRRIVLRREFGGDPGTAGGWAPAGRAAAAGAAVLAILLLAGSLGPDGVTRPRLEASVTAQLRSRIPLQQRLLGNRVPAGAGLDVRPRCRRRTSPQRGPGEWTCLLDVSVPSGSAAPAVPLRVPYDLTVQADGCYRAAAPPGIAGPATLRARDGRRVVNPLWVVYGCFDTLAS